MKSFGDMPVDLTTFLVFRMFGSQSQVCNTRVFLLLIMVL